MEYEIKHIPIIPLIKVMFFVFLVMGFILGILYGVIIINFISVMMDAVNMKNEVFQEFSGLGPVGIIMMGIVSAIFSSVIMTVLTTLGAGCYNIFANTFGGIRLKLESEELDNVLFEEEPDE